MRSQEASCQRGSSPASKDKYGQERQGELKWRECSNVGRGVHFRGPESLANQLKKKIGIREMDLRRNGEARP